MRNKLTMTSGAQAVFTDGNMFGGVAYSSCVNSDTDIHYGTVASAQIKFTLDTAIPIGTELKWECKMLDDAAFRTMGFFTVASVKSLGRNKFQHFAYDFSYALEKDCTRWFRNFLSSYFYAAFSLHELALALVQYVYEDDTATILSLAANDNYNSADNHDLGKVWYTGQGVAYINGWLDGLTVVPASKFPTLTGRAILSQIAEIIGCFVKVVPPPGEDLIFRPFLAPTENNTPLKCKVFSTQRYLGRSTQNDGAPTNPTYVRVTAGDYEGLSPANPFDTTVATVYELKDNFFSDPEGVSGQYTSVASNINMIARNLREGLITNGYLPQDYTPCSLSVINDSSDVVEITQDDFYQISTSEDYAIITGTDYYVNKNGTFTLIGDYALIKPSQITFARGTVYAVAAQIASASTIKDNEWLYQGQYLYKFDVGVVAQATIYHAAPSTTHRLNTGDVFYYDSIYAQKAFTTELISTKSGTYSVTSLSLSRGYRIEQDGMFTLTQDYAYRSLASVPSSIWYTVTDDPEGTLNDNVDIQNGKYLVEVTIGTLEITKRVLYASSQSGFVYDEIKGIVMSKNIDKTGVSVSSTGSAPGENDEIIIGTSSLQIVISPGYTVNYTVGSSINRTRNLSYFIAERFEVTEGKSYTFSASNSIPNGTIRIVGTDSNEIVTETQIWSVSSSATQFTWTPAAGTKYGYLQGDVTLSPFINKKVIVN